MTFSSSSTVSSDSIIDDDDDDDDDGVGTDSTHLSTQKEEEDGDDHSSPNNNHDKASHDEGGTNSNRAHDSNIWRKLIHHYAYIAIIVACVVLVCVVTCAIGIRRQCGNRNCHKEGAYQLMVDGRDVGDDSDGSVKDGGAMMIRQMRSRSRHGPEYAKLKLGEQGETVRGVSFLDSADFDLSETDGHDVLTPKGKRRSLFDEPSVTEDSGDGCNGSTGSKIVTAGMSVGGSQTRNETTVEDDHKEPELLELALMMSNGDGADVGEIASLKNVHEARVAALTVSNGAPEVKGDEHCDGYISH